MTVLARHGARSPNMSELSPFPEESLVRKQWGPAKATQAEADNNLTDVGRDQMRMLGRRLAEKYPSFSEIEWHSSPAGRCEESGRLFWEGYGSASPPEIEEYTSCSRNDVFKAWDYRGTPYRDHVESLKSGADPEFAERAAEYNESLAETWAKLGVTSAEPSMLLYWCTYAHCLIEAEKHFPGKDEMTKALTSSEIATFAEHAQFCWEKRFHRSGHTDEIGRLILNKITECSPGKFRLFSGHDYSILSALGAAGGRRYEDILNFGAFLVVEHYDDGNVLKLSTGYEREADIVYEPYCRQMWRENDIAATENHPFLKALADGSLPLSHFQFYIEQDAIYLKEFGRALRLLAERAPSPAQADSLRAFADGADFAEIALHDSFLEKWGKSKDLSVEQAAPHTLLYTSSMLKVVALESFAEGLAVLLPCFWVYGHVGSMLAENMIDGLPEEYERWIQMYGGEAFNAAVDHYRSLVEGAARQAAAGENGEIILRKIRQHFATSTTLEWLFWKQALDMLNWPEFHTFIKTP